MIVKCDYPKTNQHEREIVANASMAQTEGRLRTETLQECRAAHTYYGAYFCTGNGAEFAKTINGQVRIAPDLKILDVGAGRGETSIYLADQGFCVDVVEPSPDFCRVIEYIADKTGKTITIYNTAAEYLAEIQNKYEVIVFNVSLHHCDDPFLAVKNCYEHLTRGGRLFIISEPMLPFWQSQEKYLAHLEQHPDTTGHYGGNEHSYHYAEYIRMLREAGFSQVCSMLHVRYTDRQMLRQSLIDDPNKAFLRQLAKRLCFTSVYLLARLEPISKPIIELMKRLSLLQLTFVATRDDAS